MLRNNIKAINSNAQIIYELANGTIDTMNPEEELPFDINKEHLDIQENEYYLNTLKK